MLTKSRKTYILSLLTFVYGINLLDRGIMYLLLEPIKRDLDLSDTQLGIVTGIAFALFYATIGVPIGRWADRGNRVTIISVTMTLWGLTTAAMTFVTNFFQLLTIRILAGVGDAGCQPPMYSLAGDIFPGPAERTRALYVLEAAAPIAGLISFVGAGWLNEQIGWRATFLAAGIPGLMLAILVKLTVREPRTEPGRPAVQAAPSSVKDVLLWLWRSVTCRHLTLAVILMFTLGQGVVGWQANYLIRIHGMGTAELGLWMGIIQFFSPMAGLALGAFILTRFYADRPGTQLAFAAAAIMSGLPTYFAFVLLPSPYLALLVLIPNIIAFSAFVPAIFVLLQRLVPDDMRATAMMIMLMFANLIGMGIGPLSVGVASDLLQPYSGTHSLRYAMMLVSLIAPWAAWHLWRASRSSGEEISIIEVRGG